MTSLHRSRYFLVCPGSIESPTSAKEIRGPPSFRWMVGWAAQVKEEGEEDSLEYLVGFNYQLN